MISSHFTQYLPFNDYILNSPCGYPCHATVVEQRKSKIPYLAQTTVRPCGPHRQWYACNCCLFIFPRMCG